MNYLPVPTDAQLSLLAAELPGVTAVRHVRQFRGGLGCTNDAVELATSGQAPRAAVVRRYGPWHGDAAAPAARRERTALNAVARNGLLAPVVLWHGKAPFRVPALLTTYIDGRPLTRPADADAWVDQLAAAAARMHAIVPQAREHRYLLDQSVVSRRLADQLEPGARFRQHPLGPALWQRRRQLMRTLAAAPSADGSRTIVHGDFHPGNVLWREEHLVAIVDWEDAGYGDPMADIAYCATDMHYMGMHAAAERLLARYREASGRSLANYWAWTVAALCRPLPDIARWLPSWQAGDRPELTADELRRRHGALIERALAETRAQPPDGS